ncbi:hypothetical protein GUB82_27240 [Escherichia coli]|nr:hypothetical protein [Escherichia coli]
MASTEEKLLTLLLSVEHLQHTAMEQQKAVADSLAVARETLRGWSCSISLAVGGCRGYLPC